MLRYFARNSTNSVSGVHSRRTCVSRVGSALAPCQSQSNCTPGTLSHAASGGNPSASIEPVQRTAVIVSVFGGIPASPVIIEFSQWPHDLAMNRTLPEQVCCGLRHLAWRGAQHAATLCAHRLRAQRGGLGARASIDSSPIERVLRLTRRLLSEVFMVQRSATTTAVFTASTQSTRRDPSQFQYVNLAIEKNVARITLARP